MTDGLGDFGGVQCEYDWEGVDPTVAVLETIAVFEHGDPAETTDLLDAPLNTYLDLDALGALVRSGETVSVTVEVEDYHVRVDGSTVGVTPTER